MEFTTQAALIIAGIVLVLSGVFGIGAKIGSVEILKLAGWQRGILVVAGGLMVVLGVALEPDSWDV